MTAEGEIYNTAQQSGLSVETVQNLLSSGWVFIMADDKPSMWIAPEAKAPAYIRHSEPHCDKVCGNMAPHRHGFSCVKTCKECHGICHPRCPAHKGE